MIVIRLNVFAKPNVKVHCPLNLRYITYNPFFMNSRSFSKAKWFFAPYFSTWWCFVKETAIRLDIILFSASFSLHLQRPKRSSIGSQTSCRQTQKPGIRVEIWRFRVHSLFFLMDWSWISLALFPSQGLEIGLLWDLSSSLY